MKLKITTAVLAFFVTSFASYAQTSDAEADAMINLLGVQKKEAMSKLVSIPDKDSAAFWKIYSDYQKENKKIALQRLTLYERTAYAYSNLTPGVADSLSKLYFSNRMDQEKSLEEYYKKMKTAINSVVAFQFYQAEIYMTTQVRASIMQQIPTYGELKMAADKQRKF
jgi:hypothetical protein